MHHPSPYTTSTTTRAFTLIEMIGVLAIITVLASIAALNVVQRMKRAAQEADALSVETMIGALRTNILRTKQIPVPAQWPQVIATELAVPVSRVQQTPLGQGRLFLADPSLEIGSPSLPSGNRVLPYTQGLLGTVAPANPRLAFVSSLASDLPVVPQQAAAFNQVWSTPASSLPAGWSNWVGNPDDLHISRLDLRELFHRVVLSNVDPDDNAPYSLEGVVDGSGNPVIMTIGPNQQREAWYLATSVVGLHYSNQSLQSREVLREDMSYIFENGRWNRYLNYGWRPPLAGFGLLAEQFRNAPIPNPVKFGANPQAVVEEVFTYLYSYGIWAIGDPPALAPFESGGSTSQQQVPLYQVLLDAQKRLEIISNNLIN
jgi:prepilin-type N-terminal cleavage/methylation domain-containing protein